VIPFKTSLRSGNYFHAKSNIIINALLGTAVNSGMTTIIFLYTQSHLFIVFSRHHVLTKILNIAMRQKDRQLNMILLHFISKSCFLLKDSYISVCIALAVIGPLDMEAAWGSKYSQCFGDWLCLRLQI
jgi:hypothetical protein